MIQTEVGRSTSIVTEIAQIPGVTLAEDVTGPYDIIARIEAPSVDELGQGVIAKIQDVKGITRTLTCTVVKL
nr:Lrp/AsnC ligand binding domain-containing protein [Kineosporia sp. NBRC 101677]